MGLKWLYTLRLLEKSQTNWFFAVRKTLVRIGLMFTYEPHTTKTHWSEWSLCPLDVGSLCFEMSLAVLWCMTCVGCSSSMVLRRAVFFNFFYFFLSFIGSFEDQHVVHYRDLLDWSGDQ